jgi:hypothetical protein
MIIALNMSNETRSLHLDRSALAGASRLVLVLSNRPASKNRNLKDDLRLAPFEAVILEALAK